MRSVIMHFFNEEYLLPWWLKHHIRLFDHGVLIDHGSTDRSAEICRELAPHWRLVRSRLMTFDAFATDWEVMGFEQELPGWKIALTTTEFLMPGIPLADLEARLLEAGRDGCAASGAIFVDSDPESPPKHDLSLPLQKHFGTDDNAFLDPVVRASKGLSSAPTRNRFYHCTPIGMYSPGRHHSYHPDSRFRVTNLVVGHFGFSPWNEQMLGRRMQIRGKIGVIDKKVGFGITYTNAQEEKFQREYETLRASASDLLGHEVIGNAIRASCG